MYSPINDQIVRGPEWLRNRRRLKDRFIVSLLQSGRVKMGVTIAITIAIGVAFGLSPAVAMQLAIIAASWILGESVRPSTSGLLSRRFIATLAAQIAAIAANLGWSVPAEDMNSLLILVASLVFGDAWREIKTVQEKEQDQSRAQLALSDIRKNATIPPENIA